MQQTKLDQEIKAENQLVSDWLLFCPDRKTELLLIRENILHSSSLPDRNGRCKSNAISDITANKGIKLGDLEMQKWVELIEEIELDLTWQKKIFLRLRREYRYEQRGYGGKGWVYHVQYKYAEEMAEKTGKGIEECWIDDRGTFWRWWNRIVNNTARMAGKRGLL